MKSALGWRQPLTLPRLPRRNSADICRERGWGPGTELVGDEGHGPTVIRITAVGERAVLAYRISQDGRPVRGHEHVWTLEYRDWQPTNDTEST